MTVAFLLRPISIAVLGTAVCMMPLNAAETADVPKGAQTMEKSYANQKAKLVEACLKKHQKALDKLVQECIEDDHLDLAKEIRAAVKEKRLPAGVSAAETDTYFIGEWKEKSGESYSYVHKWDGKSLKERKYKGTKWKENRKKHKGNSSDNILSFEEGDPWKRCWIKIGPDRMIQVLSNNCSVSQMERMEGGEAPAPTGSYTERKADILFTRMATEIKDDLKKIDTAYAKFLQKKSREWSKKGEPDLAIWARERAAELKDPVPLEKLQGKWLFGEEEVHIENPKKFERKDKDGQGRRVYVFSSSLNPDVHIFKVERTGQSLIVARSGERLIIVPYDLKGKAVIGKAVKRK